MKKRYFYLEDINTVETVETMTKKELISHAEGFKNYTFCEHDEVISGYTKDGKFFYYDCTNFWNFKKSDIVNAISVVYSSESGYYVYGDYTVNMYGIVNPTEDGETLIWTGGNIKEVESADYSETEEEPAADQEPETIKPFDELTEEELDAIIAEEVEKEYFGEPAEEQEEETAEPKKQYDVFYTNQSIPSLAIYNHKPDRWKYDIPPVLAMETEKSLYFCPAYYNVDDVVKFLKRNAARSENK